jgi:hypothetical protein
LRTAFSEPEVDSRAANPGAKVVNAEGREDLLDVEFYVYLVGWKALNMSYCTGITDAGLAHLVGIHTLRMHRCTWISNAGLAHLVGVHTLNMRKFYGIQTPRLGAATSESTVTPSKSSLVSFSHPSTQFPHHFKRPRRLPAQVA